MLKALFTSRNFSTQFVPVMKKKSNAKDSASHSVAKLAVDDVGNCSWFYFLLLLHIFFQYNKSISVNTNGQIVLRVRAKPGAKKTLVTG